MLKSGELTLEHLEWFLSLSKDDRDALTTRVETVGRSLEAKRFIQLVDLGLVSVPQGDDYTEWFATLRTNGPGGFFPDEYLGEDFSHLSAVLTPGKRFRVRVFGLAIGSASSVSEVITFLKEQGCVFLGIHGASLMFQEKIGFLKQRKLYVSFDATTGNHAVTCIEHFRMTGGSTQDKTGRQEIPLDHRCGFLCFNPIS